MSGRGELPARPPPLLRAPLGRRAAGRRERWSEGGGNSERVSDITLSLLPWNT